MGPPCPSKPDYASSSSSFSRTKFTGKRPNYADLATGVTLHEIRRLASRCTRWRPPRRGRKRVRHAAANERGCHSFFGDRLFAEEPKSSLTQRRRLKCLRSDLAPVCQIARKKVTPNSQSDIPGGAKPQPRPIYELAASVHELSAVPHRPPTQIFAVRVDFLTIEGNATARLRGRERYIPPRPQDRELVPCDPARRTRSKKALAGFA